MPNGERVMADPVPGLSSTLAAVVPDHSSGGSELGRSDSATDVQATAQRQTEGFPRKEIAARRMAITRNVTDLGDIINSFGDGLQRRYLTHGLASTEPSGTIAPAAMQKTQPLR